MPAEIQEALGELVGAAREGVARRPWRLHQRGRQGERVGGRLRRGRSSTRSAASRRTLCAAARRPHGDSCTVRRSGRYVAFAGEEHDLGLAGRDQARPRPVARVGSYAGSGSVCAPMPQGARRRMVWLRRRVRARIREAVSPQGDSVVSAPRLCCSPRFRQSLYADDSLPGAWHWLG